MSQYSNRETFFKSLKYNKVFSEWEIRCLDRFHRAGFYSSVDAVELFSEIILDVVPRYYWVSSADIKKSLGSLGSLFTPSRIGKIIDGRLRDLVVWKEGQNKRWYKRYVEE